MTLNECVPVGHRNLKSNYTDSGQGIHQLIDKTRFVDPLSFLRFFF